MKQIQLANGMVAIVDDGDYEIVARLAWQAELRKGVWYAIHEEYTPRRRKVRMHRLILAVRQDQLVDHKDHDGLNNTRANLRICTPAQNNHNRRPSAHSSDFKGVTWRKNRSRWVAQIQFKGKGKFLGQFHDEIEAAKAYDRAATRLFGEFACVNGA